MIVYNKTRHEFHDDILTNAIEDIIHNAYHKETGRYAPLAEIRSWANSLGHMDRVLNTPDIAPDAGVAIEYHIPRSSKRIDFIISGRDAEECETIVLIELKQWEAAALTDKDALVITRLSRGLVETTHPSYQAWSYRRLLEDYNATVEEEHIRLHPCAYLHNYGPDNVLTHERYQEYVDQAPLFLKPDALKLRGYIGDRIKRGDDTRILHRIEHGRIRPSKNLADSLAAMLKGNREFVLIDEQKVAYETALRLAMTASPIAKKVLVIRGGPGTGKSVLAINLLVRLTEREHNVRYVTRNSAPRKVYEAKLAGTLRRSRIAEMFVSSGEFHAATPGAYDTLIVDEAHRLSAKSGMFSHLGENQVKEVVDASNCVIFFLDEDQRVTLKDIGDMEQIRQFAAETDAEIVTLELESQFRCDGSDGYLAWLDDALQVRTTANTDFSGLHYDYDFRIFDDPGALHDHIRSLNGNNKARMVAGYCWDWLSKKDPGARDIIIGEYAEKWNLASYGQAWIIQPESVEEVGCIHTCQGLEVDHIGVIIGPDLVVRNGVVITDPSQRSRMDKSISGWKTRVRNGSPTIFEELDRIIKNTYRTLMTRGQKSCSVYFTDAETREYFKARMER